MDTVGRGIRVALAIAWKELQVTARDRGLLAVLFLLPLIFASLFSLSQQEDVDEATGVARIRVEVFVVNEDEGRFGRQVADALRQLPVLDVETLGSVEEADRRVSEGERTAAIVIPAGFSDRIDAYEPSAVKVIVDPVQAAIGGVVMGVTNFAVTPAAIEGELAHGVDTFMARTGALEGATPELVRANEARTVGAIMTQLRSMASDPGIVLVSEDVDDGEVSEPVNLFDVFMPAFAVMFAFFLTGHIGQTFHRERDAGTFRRLLAAPVGASAMIAGPMLAYVIIVVAQVVFLFGIGAAVFGMDIGDSLLGLLAVSGALGLVVATFGLLLGALAGSGRQADLLGTLIAFALPFLSGIFPMTAPRPEYLAGGLFAEVGRFVPHQHAAEGYRLVMSGEGTLETVLFRVGVLLLFAAVFFVLAMRRLRFD
jgi:ABC-2 type transport system permease protein